MDPLNSSKFEDPLATEYELGRFSASFKAWGDQYDGEAIVVLSTQPSPRVLIIVVEQESGHPFDTTLIWESLSDFKVNGCNVEGFFAGLRKDRGGNAFAWQPSQEPMTVDTEMPETDQLGFSLFDFPNIRIGPTPLQLESSGLEVSISEAAGIDESIRATNEDGIPRVTHDVIVGFNRLVPKEFALCTQAKLLDFFSFLSGKKCFAVCPWGRNSSTGEGWQAYSSPYKERGAGNWFGGGSKEQISDLFSGFLTLRESEIWAQSIHEAVYWYVNANNSSRGVDAGLILTQAALELLAYNFVVNDRKLMTAQGFKDISRASDKLRLLLGSFSIRVDIPDTQLEINRVIADPSNNIKWIDLPHSLTEIRNSLVHPDAKNREIYYRTLAEAWRCSLWLLELCILRLSGYNGLYSSRVSAGPYRTYGRMPWETGC